MELELTFSPTDPPRQGDLIAKSRIQERHPFDRFGIVVTADCDMERARADHIITYLKVVPVADYVRHVWCRKKIHRMVERLRTDVSSSFNRLWKQADPARVDLSAARFGEWLFESGPDQVCAELAGADEGAVAKLAPRVAQLSSALKLSNIDHDQPAFDALIAIRELSTGEEQAKVRQGLIKEAINELSKESDEVFFISRLVTDEEGDGYYVLLDNIGTIRREHLYDYRSQAEESPEGAHRFGRLEKTFKYAVVQRFAFLFQRIGLPDARASEHQAALGKIA